MKALLPAVPARPRTPAEREQRAEELRVLLSRGAKGLPARVSDWQPAWRALWEERAAIMEYLGGLDRGAAEREAESDVRAAHRRGESS